MRDACMPCCKFCVHSGEVGLKRDQRNILVCFVKGKEVLDDDVCDCEEHFRCGFCGQRSKIQQKARVNQ